MLKRHCFTIILGLVMLSAMPTHAQEPLRIIAYRGAYWHLQLGRVIAPTDSLPMAANELAILTNGKILYQLKGPGPKVTYMRTSQKQPLPKSTGRATKGLLSELTEEGGMAFATERLALKYPISAYGTDEPSGFMLVVSYPDGIRQDAQEYKKRATLWADSLVLSSAQLRLPARHPMGAEVRVIHHNHKENLYRQLGRFTWYSPDTLKAQAAEATKLLKTHAPSLNNQAMIRQVVLALAPGLAQADLQKLMLGGGEPQKARLRKTQKKRL